MTRRTSFWWAAISGFIATLSGIYGGPVKGEVPANAVATVNNIIPVINNRLISHSFVLDCL